MRRSILLVDDEPYILRILSFKLRREGYETFEARSAEAAEALLAERAVDLVLLDVELASSTDGFELASRLRGRPATRDLPIIMLTAHGQSEDILQGREVGAAGYVTKPFSTADLLQQIRSILRS